MTLLENLYYNENLKYEKRNTYKIVVSVWNFLETPYWTLAYEFMHLTDI